jgi:hypothetical protein
MFKIDRKVCDLVETAYLWLLDRTGVCLAPLCMIVLVLSYGLLDMMTSWLILLSIGLNGLFLSWLYYLQVKDDFKTFNDRAISWRDSTFRMATMLLCLLFAVTHIFNPRELVGWLLAGLFNYMLAIRIRERDRKPFFETRLTPAPQQSQG